MFTQHILVRAQNVWELLI